MDGIHYSSMEYLRHWGVCAFLDADASLATSDVQTVVQTYCLCVLSCLAMMLTIALLQRKQMAAVLRAKWTAMESTWTAYSGPFAT